MAAALQLAGLSAAAAAPARAGAGYTTTVNPATSWGVWEGWGTSLCWWANVFGDRDDLADAVFTLKDTTVSGVALPGLGFNIARYNAGGSGWRTVDGASMQVSSHIPRWKQIEGYWEDWYSKDPASSSWNWTKDAKQRLMVKKAQERGANLIELFSNSPMWWMLYNHNPSGSPTGLTDNLQDWNYDQHAVYMAEVARYASQHWGIDFVSVEPFNEPISNWWKASGTQEGCHFGHGTQETVANLLRQELDQRGMHSTLVAASDENQYDGATKTWNSFNATTKKAVGKVNVHGYQQGGGRRDLLYEAVQGKRLWNSEYGEGDASGMSLASNLNLDFRWLHNTAWVYWQAFDGGGWGLVQADPGAGTIGAPNMKYYVLAQYSRHIRPGMTIIDGGESNTIAAYDSGAGRLVLVTANYGTAQTVTYNLTNFKTVKGPASRWSTNTDGSEKYVRHPDAAVSDRSLSVPFTANTVQTLQIDGVAL
eukprot:TRINITY_DN18383_c0_g1_i1.p1 TRINITY_DN18383_c0_g1~~TRINITY_DN18383_c0_g1_i1.p1  ORF type:complete len:507 (+),score=159.30 TRINITY_DN18383_c0_g1_i1:87-1523(+)